MMQALRLGNSKALLVLGLGTLEANIFGDDLVRHIAAGRDEVATRPQVPTPERLAQLSSIQQEMVGGLALDRLHHAARSQMRRDLELQMYMVRADMCKVHKPVHAATLYSWSNPPRRSRRWTPAARESVACRRRARIGLGGIRS